MIGISFYRQILEAVAKLVKDSLMYVKEIVTSVALSFLIYLLFPRQNPCFVTAQDRG